MTDKLMVNERAFEMAYTSFLGWFFLGRKAALRKAINRYIHAVELYGDKPNGQIVGRACGKSNI